MSSFMSNTLLKRFPIMFSVYLVYLVLPNVFIVSYRIEKFIREITRGSVMCHDLTTNELI